MGGSLLIRAHMRLARILQSQGFGSRRECQAMVRAGRVGIAGEIVFDAERELPLDDLVLTVDACDWRYREQAYLALHKPPGYECSRAPRDHPGVFSLLPPMLERRGVQCVGRLDQDTTGLLLFSDDGAFIHQLISPKRQIGKTYRVRVRHALQAEMIAALRAGVVLRDDPAPVTPFDCTPLTPNELLLTIGEGRYHQVKRMLAAVGNRVEALERLAIGGYRLPPELAPGAWCWLDANDLRALFQTTTTHAADTSPSKLKATASATSMPSTAADRMPPA